ncbi:MAG: SnoaL-like domain-containing protein [Gemmatimonadetes bacterium]|nr:SnoaL-like domain-containing protein [Gemmatimonadota bacterium]
MERDTPLRIVAELYRLFAEGELAQTFDLMHVDVTLIEPGDPQCLPWAGTFRGHAGLHSFYDALGSSLSSIEIDADSLKLLPMDAGQVLALGTERGVSSATGKSYETHSAWLWTVEDGLIRHLRAFHDTAAMAGAFTA